MQAYLLSIRKNQVDFPFFITMDSNQIVKLIRVGAINTTLADASHVRKMNAAVGAFVKFFAFYFLGLRFPTKAICQKRKKVRIGAIMHAPCMNNSVLQ